MRRGRIDNERSMLMVNISPRKDVSDLKEKKDDTDFCDCVIVDFCDNTAVDDLSIRECETETFGCFEDPCSCYKDPRGCGC